jgi:hypothetical protein
MPQSSALGVKEARRFEGAKVVLNFAWRTLREGIYHATVVKVRKREVVRGGLSLLCVRGFRVAHGTVAKDVKFDKRNGICGGLSGLRVRGYITPRSPRTQSLRTEGVWWPWRTLRDVISQARGAKGE